MTQISYDHQNIVFKPKEFGFFCAQSCDQHNEKLKMNKRYKNDTIHIIIQLRFQVIHGDIMQSHGNVP